MTKHYLQPTVGTLTPLTERSDWAGIDFVRGFRHFLATELEPVVQRKAAEATADFERRIGHRPQTLAEVRSCLEKVPAIEFSRRCSRVIQENTWLKIQESYEKRQNELLAELDAADRKGPGKLEYDPNFRYPEYFQIEHHLQPGGFDRHPLMGHIYQYGTYTIIPGSGDGEAAQRKLVDEMPAPPDGQVKRILDVGVSAGATTTRFKQRYPQAEVWGIDPGLPMVRYAHKRAVDLGIDVNFAQRLGEDTKFPDAHFDLVFSFIVLHEVPLAVAKSIVVELRRVLRPGGLLVIEDVPNFRADATALRHFRNFNIATHNKEPYWYEWTLFDFKSYLSSMFRNVRSRRSGVYDLEGNDDMTIAEKY
jgi:ubiquinone/menaquinone biosynthesis C-methylase UbiE